MSEDFNLDNISNKNNQLDSLAVLLQELIEKYADQLDFEKLEVPPRCSEKNKNEDNINSSD
ncbi:TPA: cobalt ABC transporter [Streptococcus agalactiae]|nr:cobalt ABC transporter [Streptococcus agalactiae]HEN9174474.1 cobalt ABC transporter [Streptococcus agalactiae]HEN9175986.1 cobalt ABC transporter [Streptococcus agalactiae]HEO1272206.1 cobalt ABC transporter [Streptococcus agalactiae]HEO1274037.1 cobalt ABC transporter [Streptococcus agalactiae]